MIDYETVRVTIVPDRIARRGRRNIRISMLTSFGGVGVGTGLVGLLSHGPIHHPVFDTVCFVLGLQAVICGLIIHYRLPNIWQ